MNIARVWSMPTGDTFDSKPIGEMVKRYLSQSRISIDPFARNKRWATYTNDLNPDTAAEYHMDALDFLIMLHEKKVEADLIIFDPPYSPHQVKELYNSIGQTMTQQAAQRTHGWSKEKEVVYQILPPGGVFLYFGWDSVGMGKSRHCSIEEVLLVCHGPGHHDTICMAERKLVHQAAFTL